MENAWVKVKATMPRRAYIRGETIPVAVEVNNQDGNVDIESVKGRIVLRGSLYSTSYQETQIKVDGKCQTVSCNVEKGKNGKCLLDLPLDFAKDGLDSNLIPPCPGTLEGHPNVVEAPHYKVKLEIIRKGFTNENFKMYVPVKIGTINSKAVPKDMNQLPDIPPTNLLY